MFTKKKLEEALNLLGSKLELENISPIELIVCGGASLIISGLVTRTTKDIDIVAVSVPDENGKDELSASRLLPEALKTAAGKVAREMGLNANWLNMGPWDIMKFGLPLGFMERTKRFNYGRILSVRFLGRYDLIHLKVYAAVDQGPGKLLDDLYILKPVNNVLEAAARWAMEHDPSDEFRRILKEMLEKTGYESVSEKI